LRRAFLRDNMHGRRRDLKQKGTTGKMDA
jgi:hypothetical protein